MPDYGQLFERYQVELLRYIYGLVNDSETARDLTQETFVRGYKLWLDEAGREGWRPLLYKIATNCALDWLRRHHKIRFMPWETPDDTQNDLADELAATGADPATGLVIRLAIEAALKGLDLNAATCLLLYYDQGFSCAEIARITGATEPAIWQRLSRARRNFCNLYRKELASDV